MDRERFAHRVAIVTGAAALMADPSHPQKERRHDRKP